VRPPWRRQEVPELATRHRRKRTGAADDPQPSVPSGPPEQERLRCLQRAEHASWGPCVRVTALVAAVSVPVLAVLLLALLVV
jgi:hypothetical protein